MERRSVMMTRTLVFVLYKYFPFGGLQRDFLRIAKSCQERTGCQIVVLTMSWEGEKPQGWQIMVAPKAAVWALSQIGSYKKFTKWVHHSTDIIAAQILDGDATAVSSSSSECGPINPHPSLREANSARRGPLVIGFNKMPNLDFYYAADPCFAEKAQTLRGGYYKFTPRFRHFMDYERAVFVPTSKTQILTISKTQLPFFQKHYDTPNDRLHMLPPGVARDRIRPDNATEIREKFREEFKIETREQLLLLLGSDFKRKGLDRVLQAIAVLRPEQRESVKLFVVGKDNPKSFKLLARSLGLSRQLTIFFGRNDVPRFLLGADLLLHPAYHENTGTVILEALAAGLPVIATANCGFAHYVAEANAGVVIPEPFEQETLNQALSGFVNAKSDKPIESTADAKSRKWSANALAFAKEADIYSMPERAAEIILALQTPRADDTPRGKP